MVTLPSSTREHKRGTGTGYNAVMTERDPIPTRHATRWLLQCRPGFGADLAAELADWSNSAGVAGWSRVENDQGRVDFHSADGRPLPTPPALTFARQAWPVVADCPQLPERDRVGALLEALAPHLPEALAGVWLEHPDTNDGKALGRFCRKFRPHLERALRERGVALERAGAPRLHLWFADSRQVVAGLAPAGSGRPWPMGIPRLRLPRAAPSRSALKLEEAVGWLLTPVEREAALRPGMSAVDLGAAPGGWTWALRQAGLHVTAVDNGPLAESLRADRAVRHLREDGFRYRPPHRVDWLVCDMVEQPHRVARLVRHWLVSGWCGRALFNLKLPMRRRWQCVAECRALVTGGSGELGWRSAQLYHDREEITVLAWRPAAGSRG